MNTRRELAVALMGLPVAAGAVLNKARPDIPEFSEAAARIISYTLYAEARGEPFKGKMAVAAVIQTRSRWFRHSLVETCRQDRQFSCWNEISAVPESYRTGEGIKPSDRQARSDCYGIAWVLMTSRRDWDFFTHFYNPDKASPDWAAHLRGKQVIGNHVFGYIDD